MVIWNLNPGLSDLRVRVPDALPMKGGGDLRRALGNPGHPWTPGFGGGIVENKVVKRLRQQRLIWRRREGTPLLLRFPDSRVGIRAVSDGGQG